ncbi:hypothetical protein DC20_12080 [Rufibacter tibetensis]|uniref:Uncharacterized protein n=2 Tax=Rufibacter tibetensis TaxID=512763 RepID=A0A0P0CYI7_9BACT|nr:hypothetical protein DC20_12080 [Rufibacter tibetensis]
MKVPGILPLLFLIYLFVSALEVQAQKIKYETGTVEQVLAKARQEDKPVFIALTWPTSTSAKAPNYRNIISALEDPAVAKLFNAEFLNVKVERNSAEGSKLTRQYSVKEYPTYLYLNPDGNLIHRSKSHSSSPKKYLDEVKAFKEKAASNFNLSYFQKEFDQGRRNADFLLQYLNLQKQMGLPADLDLLETYVSQLPVNAFDNFSTVQFILEQGPIVDSKAFVFSRSNKTILDSIYKTLPFSLRSQINNSIIDNTMRKATATKDAALAQKGAHFARITWDENYARGLRAYQTNMVNFYRSIKDTTNYLREAASYYDRYFMAISLDSVRKIMTAQTEYRNSLLLPSKGKPATPPKPASGAVTRTESTYRTTSTPTTSFVMQLNNAAYSIYETGTRNPTYLTKAMLWSKRTIEVEPVAPYYNTLAHILYRLQLFAEAEAMQQKAVELASKENQPTERFKKSLQQIKARTL